MYAYNTTKVRKIKPCNRPKLKSSCNLGKTKEHTTIKKFTQAKLCCSIC